MKYLTFLLPLLFFWACSSSEQEEQDSTEATTSSELSGFEGFYKRFHEDSLFQIEHIVFPLEGLPSNIDSTVNQATFRWQKENWIMHRPFDNVNGEYQVEFTPLSDKLIIEKITHKTGQFGMMRRFAKLGEDWFLIYYAGMNRLSERPKNDVG